mgnify:CR=1 FL=1
MMFIWSLISNVMSSHASQRCNKTGSVQWSVLQAVTQKVLVVTQEPSSSCMAAAATCLNPHASPATYCLVFPTNNCTLQISVMITPSAINAAP